MKKHFDNLTTRPHNNTGQLCAKGYVMRKRKYRNPPIVEVVSEFRLARSFEWAEKLVDDLHERLKNLFPIRKPMSHMHVTWTPQETSSLLLEFQKGWRLSRGDERAFVQIYPHRISVHHLAPYPHWEGFRPMILEVFSALRHVLPELWIERLGLRYINRITLPQDVSHLSGYFTLYPHIGPALPQTHKAFGVYLLLPFENDRDALHLRLGSGEVQKHAGFQVLLDLDYFLAHPEGWSQHQIPEWMDTAHGHIVEVFEGVITDRLRAQFEEVDA